MPWSEAPPGAQQGTIRWGSDYTGGNWWDAYIQPDGDQPVMRAPDADETGFYYFWSDTIAQVFFPSVLGHEEFAELWVGPWEPTPTD